MQGHPSRKDLNSVGLPGHTYANHHSCSVSVQVTKEIRGRGGAWGGRGACLSTLAFSSRWDFIHLVKTVSIHHEDTS